MSVGGQQLIAGKEVEIGGHHVLDEGRQVVFRLPVELGHGFGRVAEQQVYLRWPEIPRVDAQHFLTHRHRIGRVAGRNHNRAFVYAFAVEGQFNTYFGKRHPDKVADARGDAGRNHKVFGLLLLQDQVHGFDIVFGVAPVAQRVEVAEVDFVLQAECDAGHGARNLARHEGFAPQRRFVVEQDTIAGVHVVGLAVVHRNPVAIQFGHGIGRARVKRRRLRLRMALHTTVELRGRCLVDAGFLRQAQQAHRFQNPQRTDTVDLGGVFRFVETHPHVRHRPEVINLVGLYFLNDADDVGRVGEVAVMEFKPYVFVVRIFIQVVDALRIEERAAALDAMDFVAFAEEEFGEVGAVLSGDSGD